jgi:hypothetical protein
MSRSIWTWAFEAHGNRANAMVPAANPAFVSINKSSRRALPTFEKRRSPQ